MTKIRDKTIFSGLLCLVVPLFCFAEPSADPLVGVWKHSAFVQLSDGKVVRKYDSADGATLEYRANGTWRLKNPPHQSSGTYRWTNGLLESTITGSDLPHQIGFTSMKKATIHDQTLVLVMDYDEEGMKAMPARPDGTRPKSMTATSTFRKITAVK
ncbi:hypothetical protein Q4S45_19500 [Massilia sp. R2A-15]|uniref:hypothetical protein n=1 Tax=Massilia sp. R2A-15 TaxID=3064278 RepID=UPI002734492B|nr:hypothetical protein [Massilia sp. R2A-15]WLI88865.1 hypothetical protein Q4S45_19500 [Massilia sp. R2A-15]